LVIHIYRGYQGKVILMLYSKEDIRLNFTPIDPNIKEKYNGELTIPNYVFHE